MPSLPNCFSPLNVQFFTNLKLQIDAVETAVDLQALVDSAYADISLLESTITAQIALLEPILALLSAPAESLAAIVTWINSFIAVLNQLYLPSTNLSLQLSLLGIQVTGLTAAIEAVAALKFPGVTITIPEITINCQLPIAA